MLHHDPGLIDLPHPVRVDAAFGRPMEEALFGPEFWTALKPWLGDETVPTEWILNHAPGVYELARDSSNVPGTVNLGLLSLVLARARLRTHGDPVLQVHPALYEQLLETDLGAKLPVELFRLPYIYSISTASTDHLAAQFDDARGLTESPVVCRRC